MIITKGDSDKNQEHNMALSNMVLSFYLFIYLLVGGGGCREAGSGVKWKDIISTILK